MAKGTNQYTYKALDSKLLEKIQNDYNNGATLRELNKKYKLSFSRIYTLKEKGYISLDRTRKDSMKSSARKRKGKPLSEETKRKISESRKRWITENPDKSPYIVSHKSRGETYPEKYFREWLEKENIPFQQEYRFKLYAFDFLVNERVDLEIDGDQHKNDKRIIEHDIKRDAKSKDAGFIVYRIMWSNYKKLNQEERETFLCELKSFLMNNSNPIPQFVIKKKQPKIKKVKSKNKKIKSDKPEDPRKKEALKMLILGKSYCEVGRKFNVSDNAIRKWIKSLGLDPKHYGRDGKKNKNLIMKSSHALTRTNKMFS